MQKTTNKYRLQIFGLPVIENLYDFSTATRLSQKLIYNLSNNSKYYYKVYNIPKKNSGCRVISQPSRTLKVLQSWILKNILQDLKVSQSSKGFEVETSVLDNAMPHQGANAILCIDLNDFFPSIKGNWIYTIFRSIGYNKFISSLLTSICTYDGSLPQGSPCSPKLSNLVCLRLDARLQGYVGKQSIIYTRYADDLTFSALSIKKLVSSYKTIRRIIQEENFSINKDKTRLAGPSRRKKVTGLVLTDNSVGIGREKSRIIRSKLHHLSTNKNSTDKDVQHIKGWLSFIKSVDKLRYESLFKYIHVLKVKHPTSLIIRI